MGDPLALCGGCPVADVAESVLEALAAHGADKNVGPVVCESFARIAESNPDETLLAIHRCCRRSSSPLQFWVGALRAAPRAPSLQRRACETLCTLVHEHSLDYDASVAAGVVEVIASTIQVGIAQSDPGTVRSACEALSSIVP